MLVVCRAAAVCVVLHVAQGDERKRPIREELVAVQRHIKDRKSTRLNSSHLVISYAVSPYGLASFPTRRSSDRAMTWLTHGKREPGLLHECPGSLYHP